MLTKYIFGLPDLTKTNKNYKIDLYTHMTYSYAKIFIVYLKLKNLTRHLVFYPAILPEPSVLCFPFDGLDLV